MNSFIIQLIPFIITPPLGIVLGFILGMLTIEEINVFKKYFKHATITSATFLISSIIIAILTKKIQATLIGILIISVVAGLKLHSDFISPEIKDVLKNEKKNTKSSILSNSFNIS